MGSHISLIVLGFVVVASVIGQDVYVVVIVGGTAGPGQAVDVVVVVSACPGTGSNVDIVFVVLG